MTIDQKRNCVEELLNELRSRLMSRLGDVPDEWEGGELRTWIADSARSMCVVLAQLRYSGRLRISLTWLGELDCPGSSAGGNVLGYWSAFSVA